MANKRNYVSRFFSATAETFAFARAANELASTPNHVFDSRGTTRERALRDLVERF